LAADSDGVLMMGVCLLRTVRPVQLTRDVKRWVAVLTHLARRPSGVVSRRRQRHGYAAFDAPKNGRSAPLPCIMSSTNNNQSRDTDEVLLDGGPRSRLQACFRNQVDEATHDAFDEALQAQVRSVVGCVSECH